MKQWFVLRVQAGREDSIKEALWKRIQTGNIEDKLATLMVPTETVTEIRNGKKRTFTRKTFPGYIVAEVEVDQENRIPEDVWFLIRDTPGVGDFLGSNNKPLPMTPDEVNRMLFLEADQITQAPQVKIEFRPGAKVKIADGPFQNHDGEVEEVFPAKGMVRVRVTIFGRPTSLELEYWQVEAV